MKSTLKREFKEREIAERETLGTIVVVWGRRTVAAMLQSGPGRQVSGSCGPWGHGMRDSMLQCA